MFSIPKLPCGRWPYVTWLLLLRVSLESLGDVSIVLRLVLFNLDVLCGEFQLTCHLELRVVLRCYYGVYMLILWIVLKFVMLKVTLYYAFCWWIDFFSFPPMPQWPAAGTQHRFILILYLYMRCIYDVVLV